MSLVTLWAICCGCKFWIWVWRRSMVVSELMHAMRAWRHMIDCMHSTPLCIVLDVTSEMFFLITSVNFQSDFWWKDRRDYVLRSPMEFKMFLLFSIFEPVVFHINAFSATSFHGAFNDFFDAVLSTYMCVGGCGWPVSMRVRRVTVASWKFSNASAVSHSAAEETMFWAYCKVCIIYCLVLVHL